MEPQAITAICGLFAARQEEGIDAWLTDDIELRPPTYGKSWYGKPLVSRLLRFAAASFDSLRYTDCLGEGGLYMLRFEAMVGDRALSGIDLVRLDADGRIMLFEIFSRPPKVALDLLARMGAHIEASDEVRALMQSR